MAGLKQWGRWKRIDGATEWGGCTDRVSNFRGHRWEGEERWALDYPRGVAAPVSVRISVQGGEAVDLTLQADPEEDLEMIIRRAGALIGWSCEGNLALPAEVSLLWLGKELALDGSLRETGYFSGGRAGWPPGWCWPCRQRRVGGNSFGMISFMQVGTPPRGKKRGDQQDTHPAQATPAH